MGFLDRLFGSKRTAVDVTPRLTHRVGINETCRTLAERFYGSDARWEEIYAANQRILKDEVQLGTDKLLPGTEIVVLAPRYTADGTPFTAPAPT
jgi:nucleoid-associated protein YgaU